MRGFYSFLMKITYYHFLQVDSTNGWAKENSADFQEDTCYVISASEQTGGRGRHKRAWLSPKDVNLYLTFSFFEESLPPFFFSQLACLALKDLLKEEHLAAFIKWPNDLLIENKKIAGILTEIQQIEKKEEEKTLYKRLVILGIGFNVNMTENMLQTISQPATSLFEETKKTYSVPEIRDRFVTQFLHYLEAAKKAKKQEQFQKKWVDELEWMKTKEIKVTEHNRVTQGKVDAIFEDGSLLIKTTDGTHQTILSGDLFTT